MSALGGVTAGSYLFVAAAMLLWRRRGWAGQLHPGHWLAIAGVLAWVTSAITWLFLSRLQGSPVPSMWLASTPRMLLGLIMFIGFLWLGLRANENACWRRTF